jgi:ATP-dependent Clp protease ATP-binding subunit ClpA
MLNDLPRRVIEFFRWWAIDTPTRIYKLSRRIMVLVNSQLSFTLNIRLIFTPLFGDYTIVGRLIGFLTRSFEIVIGLLFMAVFTIVLLVLPVVWWGLPFILMPLFDVWPILMLIGIYVIYVAKTKDTPAKRVVEVTGNDILSSFRPNARRFANMLENNFAGAFQKLGMTEQIEVVLKRSELGNTDFVNKLSQAPNIDSRTIAQKAFEIAQKYKTRYVELEHVFLAAILLIPKYDITLANYAIEYELIESAVDWIVEQREVLAKMYVWQDDYEMMFTGGVGKGMTGHVTPLLDAMSEDFTKRAKNGSWERFTVRKDAIRKIGEMLSGSRENILVIGDPGSGKTSLIKGIAHKVIEGTEYQSLTNKRIVSMELGGIIAGTKSHGELSERLNNAINEAKHSADIILFIDEIHTLVAGAGNSSAESSVIFSILEPQLAAGDIQFIGATSKQNYRKLIEPNGAFARLFNILELDPASKEESIAILKYEVAELEKKRGVFVTFPALKRIVDLSEKLMHERVLPDKAVQILDRTASSAAHTTKKINVELVEHEIAEMTKIPIETVSEDEAKKLLNIETELKKMVVGQDHAIKQIGAALKRARAGMRDEKKPIASFLFVGTTGVGKTQTAKSLAKTYFGDAKNMIRLDMSEYQQVDSLSRLIGAPDGSTRGILTEKVRSQPFALLLLDELEKAHHNILLTFLQVLDDGRMTDSTGVTVDFTNTIIIATSNAGTRVIQQAFESGKSGEEMKEAAMIEVRKAFAPEFLNRFNGIIVFNPLSRENVHDIALLALRDVATSADEKGIKVAFSEQLVNEVVRRGYNPEWGARPMARVIEDTVESYMAEKILAGEMKRGDEVELGVEVFENID